MFSIIVAVAVVGTVSSATPPKTSDEPAMVVLEVDAHGSTSERTSMMRREVGINMHQRAPESRRTAIEGCDTNVALDTSGDAERKWAGKCNTLADCKAACKAWTGCTAFNWWPRRGGCRLIKGDLDENVTPRRTNWTTVSGVPDCVLNITANIGTIGPHDCAACSSNCASKKCSNHPECAKLNLVGDCCPSSAGTTLDCCEKVYTELEAAGQCKNHQGCALIGLQGTCCPTSAGVMLECCDQDLGKDDLP
jgi:hypothetical protein